MKLNLALLFFCLQYCNSFAPSSNRYSQRTFALQSSSADQNSYEFDYDESAEQGLAKVESDEESVETLHELTNGSATVVMKSIRSHNSRYDDVLEEVGLSGTLSTLNDLPKRRPVHSNDVFCNRELKLSNIQAVGFDMDYTLAQYKQPAFDKLAFDGAKQKLVHKFGYPKELLNVEYDHTVSMTILLSKLLHF